jgi:hypothetical protein
MAELTAPDSTSVGITRLGRSATETAAELGPLADLVGAWFGSQGWEVIAVPVAGTDGFRLIARPYIEVLTFEAIGAPVPNRGWVEPDIFIAGLLYETRITDRDTNEPLHLENGMWLNVPSPSDPQIVRQASIPHGDVFLAQGTANVDGAAPVIPDNSALPDGSPTDQLGYTDPYNAPVDGFVPINPNAALQAALETSLEGGKQVTNTTTLDVSTANDGGVVNIPFVTRNANTTQFACTYWIETIEDPTTGDQVQQLQYTQQSNLEFLVKFETSDPIMWPHINVNTLRKQ